MSKHDFTVAEFAGRLSSVRHAMSNRKIDWLVAVHPASIHWLTGSDAKSYQEFQCLMIGADGEPLRVLTRWGEVHEFSTDSIAEEVHGFGGGENEDPLRVFAGLAQRLGMRGKRVGLEVPAFYLHPYHYAGLRSILGDATVSDETGLIPSLKLVKSAAEIENIRRAAALADLGMDQFVRDLSVDQSELALAGGVLEALLRNGSGIAASPINLVTGPRSAYSHGAPTGRRLQAGDFGNIEFGATFNRYTATIGRNFVLGEPTVRMSELHELVLSASDAMIATIRDGVPATVPHRAACEVIDEAGLSSSRVHLSGYSLGPGFPPSWAEPLHMIGDSPQLLKAGMVVTIEPPVFVAAEGLGARIIDNVLVTTTGVELLTRTSRDLIVVE
jgi:Xaa-Pro dipeptidase